MGSRSISARSPCRVDLAGATLDIWPLYLFHDGALTINFAVSLYTSCSITVRKDSRIILRSRDLNRVESFESLSELRRARVYRLPLLARLVRFFSPAEGIDVESNSEAPLGAGISGSSALMISAACALNQLTNRKLKLEDLRAVAQNVEAQVIRVPTGSQDYYPAMYGGVSVIELSAAGVSRRAVDVEAAELESRVVLAYTGAPRNSGINNWEVMKAHIDGDRAVQRNFARIAVIASSMCSAIESRDWDEAGRLMREEWAQRRRNAPGISTPFIDRLITVGRRNGCIGAKVCGAGGGGCVVFLAHPDSRERVARSVAAAGGRVLSSKVARRGVVLRTSAPAAEAVSAD